MEERRRKLQERMQSESGFEAYDFPYTARELRSFPIVGDSNKAVKERITSSFWGFVLGDCWGVPYEFKRSNQIRFKKFDSFGTHNQEAGTWSDDTSLMLCNIESYTSGKYLLSKEQENLKLFIKGKYSINNILFDIGNATRRSIHEPDCDKSEYLGNGGLLRCWLFSALIALEEYNETDFIESLNLTHSTNAISLDACKMYFSIINSIWESKEWENEQVVEYNNWKEQTDIKKLNIDGTVVNAVIISIDSYLQNKEIEDVIRLGGDTDSNAALYGALYYGEKDFPEEI